MNLESVTYLGESFERRYCGCWWTHERCWAVGYTAGFCTHAGWEAQVGVRREEFATLAHVRATLQNQGQIPNRCLASVLKVNNIWTLLVTWGSTRCLCVLSRGLVEKRPADISFKIHLELQPGKEWSLNNSDFKIVVGLLPHAYSCPTWLCIFNCFKI